MTKILWKIHEILSSGFRGVTATRCVPPCDMHIVCIAKSMLCHGKPLKPVRSKYKIGGAQVHDESKILWKFREILSSGLGGVTDTDIYPFLYMLLSPCYAMGNPKNQSDQNIK